VVNTGTANTGATEEYNGSAWTTGLLQLWFKYCKTTFLAGCRYTNSSFSFGGRNACSTPTIYKATEEYDGSTWTTGGNLSVQQEL
jgi:hypothetical protein